MCLGSLSIVMVADGRDNTMALAFSLHLGSFSIRSEMQMLGKNPNLVIDAEK
jgi:hypothetical protein